MVLTDVAQKARDGYELPAQGVNLTDSSYVCGCLVDGWNAKGPTAPLVKALLAHLRASPIHWTILWIRARERSCRWRSHTRSASQQRQAWTYRLG